MNDDQQPALSHAAVSQALQVLFVEDDAEQAFGEVSAQQLQRHLADCQSCRRQYDAIALSARFLTARDESEPAEEPADGPADLPRSSFETGFAHASFMGALDEMLDEERADKSADDDQPATVVDFPADRAQPRPFARYLGVAAAALLVGATSWFAWQRLQPAGPGGDSPGDPGQFQARSAATAEDPGQFGQPKLEIFCAQRSADGLDFRGTEDAPFGLLSCPIDAQLKLAYANPSDKLRWAAFFGVDQTGRINWYGPTPADIDPVRVTKADELSPVGHAIRLDVNHQPGKVRVVGVFADEPVDFPRLRRMIDDIGAEAFYRGEPIELPVQGTLTSSTFEVTDAGKQVNDGGKR